MNRIWIALAIGCSLIVGACGTKIPLQTEVSANSALALKAQCAKLGIVSAETKQADSLASAGEILAAKKKQLDAIDLFDRASVLFQCAIIRKELVSENNEIQNLEKAVAQAQAQLATYSRVLSELKAMKK